MAENEPAYLDLKKLSIYSCVSVGSLRDYIKSGDLPAYRLKGKVLVKKSIFDKWVADHPFQTDIDSIADEVIESLKASESNR
jgi:hypothetical protein